MHFFTRRHVHTPADLEVSLLKYRPLYGRFGCNRPIEVEKHSEKQCQKFLIRNAQEIFTDGKSKNRSSYHRIFLGSHSAHCEPNPKREGNERGLKDILVPAGE